MHRSLLDHLRSRTFILAAGLLAITLIGVADRSLDDSIPIVLLYLVPVVVMSTVLDRWQIPLLGLFCTTAAELCDAFPWNLAKGIPRDALYFFAYTSAGLYVHELRRRRRTEHAHVQALEVEMEARRGVEEQLRLVVANSSIAIITADESGTILEANDAAEQLFRGENEATETERPTLRLSGLETFMPSLARVKIRKQGWEQLRTMMQCQGFRLSREPFLADVWFSTYKTSSGGRLTAMIVDSSLETRDREEANLEQVLVGSRLAVGALSHEIRNICAAIAIVHENLAHTPAHGRPNPRQALDFDALRQLVGALERLASQELSLVKRQATRLRLETFLGDLYIIISPSLREAGIALDWFIDLDLPDVWADQHSLLQVFLNLIRNAEKALSHSPAGVARLVVSAARKPGERDLVQIQVSDNGPGVAHPEQLFRPFAAAAPDTHHPTTSGLGLYLSRAMMHSFHGDLRFQPPVPDTPGATFILELVAAEVDP